MNKMQVYRFTLEGHNGQLAGIDVVSRKSPVEALAALVNVVPSRLSSVLCVQLVYN